jgi:hypothetical protein
LLPVSLYPQLRLQSPCFFLCHSVCILTSLAFSVLLFLWHFTSVLTSTHHLLTPYYPSISQSHIRWPHLACLSWLCLLAPPAEQSRNSCISWRKQGLQLKILEPRA